MFYTKLAILSGIVCVFAVSNPPYFPIEISRCIASTSESTWLFLCVILIAATTSLLVDKHQWNGSFVLIFTGLLTLGIADDVNYWSTHMLGVGMVMSGFLWHIMQYKWWNYRHTLFTIALGLYVLRIVIKAWAVFQWESASWHRQCRHDPIFIFGWPTVIKEKSFEIMYTGKTNSPYTLYAFSYGGGLLQWIVFILLSFCL